MSTAGESAAIGHWPDASAPDAPSAVDPTFAPGAGGAVDRAGAPARVRLIGFALLALFLAAHWSAIVVPGAPSTELAAAAVCIAVAAALTACARLPLGARTPAAVALTVALLAGSLLAVGVPLHLLAPWHLGALVDNIDGGLQALANAHVPYAGDDLWTRRVVELGGPLLLGLAALGGFWPGRGRRSGAGSIAGRVIAVAALVTLYTVAAVNLKGDAELLRGALFFFLLAGFLAAERIPRGDRPTAAVLATLAALAGLALAPALQQSRPWLNYQGVDQSLGAASGERFNWNQTYGPLDWPREGRTVLLVKAAFPAYWKAEALDLFDGREWVESPASPSAPVSSELPSDPSTVARWTQQLRVTVASLNSVEFIGAGTTTQISNAPREPIAGASVGSFRAAGGGLHDGHSYLATVYAPQPSANDLAAASATNYGSALSPYLQLRIPVSDATGGGRAARTRAVAFAAFAAGTAPSGALASPTQASTTSASALLASSPYSRVWALAGTLRAGTTSPSQYVGNVLSYLRDGFSYSEDTPVRRWPLASFLFDHRQGYCQQFSGAMALLLRMGGVPARVAVGFTTGTYQRARGVYDVTDVDAHAWVEAWFSGIGWVTFDPTPPTAPARGGTGSPIGPPLHHAHQRLPAPTPRPTPASSPAPASPHQHASWALLAGVIGAVLAIALAGGLLERSRRRRAGGAGSDAPERRLAELRRALAARGVAAAGLTLGALATRMAHAPAAAGYVRALEQERYASGDAETAGGPAGTVEPAPAASGRRALRRELARGAGPRGRMRLLIALPPARVH